MINYDKIDIKENLEMEDIFELLIDWGGEPYYQGTDIIVSRTICHNHPNNDASHKLYYYKANKMFHCYTGCQDPAFDIFELVRKVMSIQYHQDYDLNMAVRWIANRFGIIGESVKENELEDWEVIERYNIDCQQVEKVVLKEYDSTILDRFNYKVRLTPWLKEGISQESLNRAKIGFYAGGDQITIPHYDSNNRLIGIRGRTLCKEEAERFGKYRPLKIRDILYSHPLGVNLYNLNNSKDNIRLFSKAIVFEGEKSCLQYATMFGIDNDISVATCGSNLSAQQVNLLKEAGAKEIIIAFDRQFKDHNSEEFNLWVKKLKKINEKFKNDILISFIFDKNDLLNYKSSPTDEGKEKFLQLYKNKIII